MAWSRGNHREQGVEAVFFQRNGVDHRLAPVALDRLGQRLGIRTVKAQWHVHLTLDGLHQPAEGIHLAIEKSPGVDVNEMGPGLRLRPRHVDDECRVPPFNGFLNALPAGVDLLPDNDHGWPFPHACPPNPSVDCRSYIEVRPCRSHLLRIHSDRTNVKWQSPLGTGFLVLYSHSRDRDFRIHDGGGKRSKGEKTNVVTPGCTRRMAPALIPHFERTPFLRSLCLRKRVAGIHRCTATRAARS